jgi:Tfp pilus assembly protein PilF
MTKLDATLKEGFALHQRGKLADAERAYRAVLKRQPNNFDALQQLGLIAILTQRIEPGVELLKKAIRLNGKVASVHNNLGNALLGLKRLEEAVASYDRAIALKPDYALAYYNRGDALLGLKRPEEAVASYDWAIALKPDFAEAHSNRGNALRDLNRLEEAEEAVASYHRAIALKPDFADAYSNRGNALLDLRRPEEAVASYDRAIALKPDYADAYYNQSLSFLKMGQYEQGWRQYEWRKRTKEPIASRSFPQPAWLGEQDIFTKTLFLWWEQGFGDTIQFCRYAKLVEARGARVIMEVQRPLYRLLRQLSSHMQLILPGEKPGAFDYHCPMLSLPLAFRTTAETIPSAARYLSADEKLVAEWSSRLMPKTKPRIGLIWSGGTAHKNDRSRSIDLAMCLPLLNHDAHWVSLQKEIREKDRTALQQVVGLHFFGDDLEDFSDTAALVSLMDLIITVDTSVAHLAAAMGKSVWILLPYNSDWRWLLDRDDSPWYPTVRLFRQERIGDWAGVIREVNQFLSLLFSK